MDIDETRILRHARRTSGLSQAELARRGGTSKATISAYERGAKSPSLRVAQRILDAEDFELAARPIVTFTEHHPELGDPYWVPDRLWSVDPPDCFATLVLPGSGPASDRSLHLKDRLDRIEAYDTLIRWCLPHMMLRWIDGALLIQDWDGLTIPKRIKDAWRPAINAGSRKKSIALRTAFGGDPDPDGAREYRIVRTAGN